MIYTIPHILTFVTRFMTLEPGDLIMTGTPAGVGPVQPGDRLEGGVDGLDLFGGWRAAIGRRAGEGSSGDRSPPVRRGFPATDRTIEEIKIGIDSVSELSDGQRAKFLGILTATERVKFTDYDPRPEDSMYTLSNSEDLVEELRPPETAEEAEGVI